eukprot:4840347-Pyramimonas_sp.AAC.1
MSAFPSSTGRLHGSLLAPLPHLRLLLLIIIPSPPHPYVSQFSPRRCRRRPYCHPYPAPSSSSPSCSAVAAPP